MPRQRNPGSGSENASHPSGARCAALRGHVQARAAGSLMVVSTPQAGSVSRASADHPSRVALRRIFGYPAKRVNYLAHLSLRHRALFQEVPKAGCTVVKRVLQTSELNGQSDRLPSSQHDRQASPLVAPLDLDLEMDELYNASGSWFRFTFVRNPFTRALSGYLEKIAREHEMRDQRLRQLGFEAGSWPSFREFLERLADTPPARLDIHWAPATHLLATKNVNYDFIGRFESLRSDLALLIDRLGLETPPDITSRTTQHTTNARDRLEDYYGDDPVCADLVRRIYSRDFAALGYGLDPRFA